MENKELEEMELTISRFLKFGVMLSAAVIALGFLIFIFTGNSGYNGEYFPKTPVEIFKGLASLKAYAIILTGLMFLILTPVFRVGISILVFIKEKDFLYAKITALVFIILIVSFLLGKVE